MQETGQCNTDMMLGPIPGTQSCSQRREGACKLPLVSLISKNQEGNLDTKSFPRRKQVVAML